MCKPYLTGICVNHGCKEEISKGGAFSFLPNATVTTDEQPV